MKNYPRLSYDGQGVIMANKKTVVARLEPEGFELSDLLVAAPNLLAVLQELLSEFESRTALIETCDLKESETLAMHHAYEAIADLTDNS